MICWYKYISEINFKIIYLIIKHRVGYQKIIFFEKEKQKESHGWGQNTERKICVLIVLAMCDEDDEPITEYEAKFITLGLNRRKWNRWKMIGWKFEVHNYKLETFL